MSFKSVFFGLAVLVSASSVSIAQRCRITVLTRPRIPAAFAKCQAVQNRQVCRATGTALTRMSRTSIVIATGIGITVTGIGESAHFGLGRYTR